MGTELFQASRGDGVAFAEGGQHFDYGAHACSFIDADVFNRCLWKESYEACNSVAALNRAVCHCMEGVILGRSLAWSKGQHICERL